MKIVLAGAAFVILTACATQPPQQAYVPPPMPPVPQADLPPAPPPQQSDTTSELQSQNPSDSGNSITMTEADNQQKAVKALCGNHIFYGVDLMESSPFSTDGKCYQLGQFEISQWFSATQALVLSDPVGVPLNLFVESDRPFSGQSVGPGIFLGEGAYQYVSVSGAAETAYKLREILENNVPIQGN